MVKRSSFFTKPVKFEKNVTHCISVRYMKKLYRFYKNVNFVKNATI